MSAAESQSTPSDSRPALESVRVSAAPSARLVPWVRANWPIIAVFLAFAAAAIVVPTMAAVATTDDWAYTRSAQILLEEGRLTVFPVVAATAVFQIVWGAMYGLIREPPFGGVRLCAVCF